MVSVTQRNVYAIGQFSDPKGQQLWMGFEEVIFNISTEVGTVGNYQVADASWTQNAVITPYIPGVTALTTFRHFASIYIFPGILSGVTTMYQVTNLGIAHNNVLDPFFTVQTAFVGTLQSTFLRVSSLVTLAH